MRKIRILALSSDTSGASLMRIVLMRLEYEVLTVIAENWEDDFASLGQNQADAIVINSLFGGPNEVIFLRMLKKYPTLVMTTRYYENLHDMIKAHDGGYLWMPVRVDNIKNIMERLTTPIREELARLDEDKAVDNHQ